MITLWVDDLRPMPEGYMFHAKTSAEAIYWLSFFKPHQWCGTCKLTEMSLDHDLGGDDTTRPVVLWMIENDFWPVEVKVHTANPVGREWLEGMIERYKP